MIPDTPPPAEHRIGQTGFGLGLRTAHYADFLRERQPLDWLEIISDNYLGDGGKPLAVLERIRQDYPMAMHGVAMSLGGTDPLDREYLARIKALAQRIDALWISDHLCWTGHYHHRLHDLYPLPYTDEAARHVVARIRQAQDVLGRRLVIENVSSYIDFVASAQTEWQFLAHVAREADCLLLVDVNNIYVSAFNHGFDPMDYLRALPADRVQQIHLAGHTEQGACLVDTHDHPVCEGVWALYAQACALYGPVATMIERDDQIPPLPELMAELNAARRIRGETPTRPVPPTPPATPSGRRPADALARTQATLVSYLLGSDSSAPEACALVRDTPTVSAAQRLGIYHHAYRARLAEALAESFERTALFVGHDTFAAWATAFAVAHPPDSTSLSRYGAALPEYLRQRFAHNPELHELAQLDWDLRTRFDAADVPALDNALAAELPPQTWLQAEGVLHPTVLLRSVRTNVASLWAALAADAVVPPAQALPQAMGLVVWRRGHQPHFQTVPEEQLAFLRHLSQGLSVAQALDRTAAETPGVTPATCSTWLREALANGWLRQPPAAPALA